MVDSGSLLVPVFTVWAAVAMSASEANVFDFCCPAVTTQEIREPILGYFDQRANPPCVTAIIFNTQSGLFCCSREAPWVLRMIAEFERAKARLTAVSEFSLSPLSLLSVRTPTAFPSPPTSSSKRPTARRYASNRRPCCVRVTTLDNSAEVVGEVYHEQDAAPPCVKAVIFNTKFRKLCADPAAQWVQNLTAGMTKV